MFTWIRNNWPAISVIGTSVAFAGALIGWHFVSLIPELSGDLGAIFTISLGFTAMTIAYFLLQDDWRWRHLSLLDRPLPILASFVFPMFLGTWNILLDIPEYLSMKECRAKSTPGYSYVWRDDYCHTPQEWKRKLCDQTPSLCE